ncbi:SRPBCC family protein [Actinoplanes sp. NPDC000266]
MATVRVETVIDLPAELVWEAVADVGAVHRRLLPGRVADARIEGDARILTMPDGWLVRELIVAVDHDHQRLAYAVVEGQRMPLTYHHASFQVFGEGERARLVWVTDVLPHAMAGVVRGVVERGIAEIKQTLESGTRQAVERAFEVPGSGAGQSSGIDA